ncbi:MAG TPA: hypothetical protein VGH19_15780 [Verrucomicrobiae bacterium]
MKLPKTFAPIIAEEPYDEMGREFQHIFGAWLDETVARKGGDNSPGHCKVLAFQLFRRRLELAQKYHTQFAKQMLAGDRELWRERYTGVAEGHCSSFAIRQMPRTARFFSWCEQVEESPNGERVWDEKLKPFPALPYGPHKPFPVMPVWGRHHQPQFRARRDGPFWLRRLHYSKDVHLIEHPDNRWVPNIRQEAQQYWSRANDPKRSFPERTHDLASFEWLWFWTNPFGRAGALTGDALSLLTQKQMILDGHRAHIRKGYYHQDCEALLLPWEDYLSKRVNDLLKGFRPHFLM